MMRELAVTGAGGFVGLRLCHRLQESGRTVRPCVRNPQRYHTVGGVGEPIEVGDVTDLARWRHAFDGVRCVVHLAARVHEMGRGSLEEFRAVNVAGSRVVLEAAISSGVERVIFISTVKVHGERSGDDEPFRAEDEPQPADPYSISKWEAERLFQRAAADGRIDLVIIRPVLVYGPGVRANFLRLLELVNTGLPIPLGAVKNRRSILFVDNLCDLIEFCADSPRAVGQVLLASDGAPMSTPQLLRAIGESLGRPVTLLGVPPWILVGLGGVVGRSGEVRRLCESLHVDTSWMASLGWTPPATTREGLAATARWFKGRRADD